MKSKMRRLIEAFFASNKHSRLSNCDVELSSAAEAEEFCSVFQEHLHSPKQAARLLRIFQIPNDASEETIHVIQEKGTSLLLQLEPALPLSSKEGGMGDDRLFLLKLLALYGTAEGADRIISIAKSGYAPDAYLWNVIFRCFTPNHSESARVFEELALELPKGFVGVSILDAANQCSIDGLRFEHPFNSDQGASSLRQWLRDTDPENFSYAHSATAALPFIGNPPRDELLELAMDHPDTGVSVEAAWASAKIGMQRGIRQLARFAKNVNTASTAIHYLVELGREDAIPAEAQDSGFQAMAEMVNWLSHPNEFGEPPNNISLYDTRELFWPPTNDRRQLWLFRYEYAKSEHRDEEVIGLGMVGSVTFGLFGETTASLSPLEAYALHCCWELEANNDPRAPEKRGVAAGLKILDEFNDLPRVGSTNSSLDSIQKKPVQPGADELSSGDSFTNLMGQVLAKAKKMGGASPEEKKEALKAAFEDVKNQQMLKLRKEVEEFRLAAQGCSSSPHCNSPRIGRNP